MTKPPPIHLPCDISVPPVPPVIGKRTQIIVNFATLAGVAATLILGAWTARGILDDMHHSQRIMSADISELRIRLSRSDETNKEITEALRDVRDTLKDIRMSVQYGSRDRYTGSMARRVWAKFEALNSGMGLRFPNIDDIIRSDWTSEQIGAADPNAMPWRD